MLVDNCPHIAFNEKVKTIKHLFNAKQLYVVYYMESKKIKIEIKAKQNHFAQRSIDTIVSNVKEAFYIRNDIPVEVIYTGK